MATQPDFVPADEPADGEAMPDSELVSILAQYEAQSIGYEPGGNDEISSGQQKAINYYNGTMDDLPAQEGSSSVVDGTVAVVIDNALAAILKPFVSSDETVLFSPRSSEDVAFAEQATEYVNYILNCDNPGFLILHDWFKDALLTKLGVVKVWWEDQPRLEAQQVQITDDLQAAYIRNQPNYLGEEGGVALIGRQVDDGRVKIEVVPPEEFRIAKMSRSIETAAYCAHVPSSITRSDLIEMGFDPAIVESLPAYSASTTDSTLRQARYDDEDISDSRYDGVQKAQDIMALRDEYVLIDYDGDGVAERRRIMRVEDVILLNEEAEEAPFATLCPIPMPHKVHGHSLADRTMQEAKIGTAIWRQTLDNLYKSNNPRPIVGEGANMSDGSTADSLADNAPGAAILVKDRMQFDFGAVPFTADKTFPMLELLDKKVEENTGISKAGQGLDTNTLRKSGQMTATEVAQIASGKNARTEMIARIFAETGVKRLFKLVLGLVTQHQPAERIIRLRNQFVPMDPRGWPEMDVEISVGLGVGEKMEQIAQADAVLDTMAQLVQSPFASMVGPEQVYNAVKRKFTAAGIKNTDEFLISPEQMPEQQEQPDPEMVKAQMDAQLQAAKLEAQREESALKIQLAREEAAAELQLARDKAAAEMALAEQQQAFEEQMAERRFALDATRASRDADRRDRESDEKLSKNRDGGSLAV